MVMEWGKCNDWRYALSTRDVVHVCWLLIICYTSKVTECVRPHHSQPEIGLFYH